MIIDYRELLKKYIMRELDRVGVIFLDGDIDDDFSPEEQVELKTLMKEASDASWAKVHE